MGGTAEPAAQARGAGLGMRRAVRRVIWIGVQRVAVSGKCGAAASSTHNDAVHPAAVRGQVGPAGDLVVAKCIKKKLQHVLRRRKALRGENSEGRRWRRQAARKLGVRRLAPYWLGKRF